MVNILERPIFPPYACIVCGVGSNSRKWYVDTQLNLDNFFNPQNHGSIYLCNECWDSLSLNVAQSAQVFVLGQVPWETGEYVEPTYESTEELVSDGPGIPDPEPTDLNLDSTGDDSSSEGGDPDTDADGNDDELEPDPVSDFRGLFGGK